MSPSKLNIKGRINWYTSCCNNNYENFVLIDIKEAKSVRYYFQNFYESDTLIIDRKFDFWLAHKA